MNINTSSLLTLFSAKIDKSTKQVIEKLSVDGKVDISSLLKEKNVQTLLSDLFNDISKGVKNKSGINQLLTSNKQIFDFKSLSKEVNTLANLIEKNPKLQKQSTVLKEFLVNIKNIDENLLKTNIKNSGVFLESKLLKSSVTPSLSIKNNKGNIQNQQNNNSINNRSIISNDLKAAVLQIQEQIDSGKISDIPKEAKVQTDKIQTQIEFYQLLSYTSTSNHTFLPFAWEDLEDADIKFDSKNKDEFSCQINLSLKSAGELRVLLQLDNKNNLNINIGVESSDFKQTIQSNLQKLRANINSVGVVMQGLNIFDMQSKDKQTYEQKEYSSHKLNFGLDIKV